jgi:PAS domain S-box-containing protein
MAFLRATKGLETGSVCQLKPGVNTLGRDARRCDFVLQHHAVSREHARIDLLSDGVYIEDLESRNGVAVNGVPLPPGIAGRRRLSPQDRIEIAAFEFVFHDDSSTDTVAIASDQSTGSEILSTVDVSDSSRILLKQTLSGDKIDLSTKSTKAGRSSSDTQVNSQDLSSAYRKLSAVLTVIEETSGHLEAHAAPRRILESLFRIFPQTESSCLLLPDRSGVFFVAAVKNSDGSQTPPRISRSVLDFVARQKQAVLSGESSDDPAFKLSQSALSMRVRSVMCVPLIDSESNVVGVAELDTSRTRDFFTREDLQILAGVARHLAVVMENAGLHAAELNAQRAQFESRFHQLIQGSIHGVLIHRDFEPLFVNQAWAALHGYTQEEVLDLDSVLPLLAPADRARAAAAMEDLVSGRSKSDHGERQNLRKDGAVVWLEEFATVIDWEGGLAIQSTVVDLTERKRTEQILRDAHAELELRVQERTKELADANRLLHAEISERLQKQEELRDALGLYHSLVDHVPLCVVRKDVDGRFEFVNRALCKILGQPAEFFVNKTDYDLFSKEQADQYRAADQKVMETGQQLDLLEQLPMPNGEVRQIHTLKTSTHDADGNLLGTQLIFWDVTDQKRTEDERNRYAAELERSNRDLEQFAYNVSHDLQSPLRTIASYCQLLQRQFGNELKGEGKDYLANAVEATRRMRRLLDDLLAYSRVSTGPHEMMPVELEAVLAEALRNLAAAIRDNHAVVTHDRLPTISGDQTQLMQVLQNLINNALTYRRRDVAPRIHIAAEEEPTQWRFEVRDNGVGIDSQDFDRVFHLFQRLDIDDDRPGTGIGLSICKRIVERHGGRIGVKSKKGEGSVFYFTLPKRSAAG